MPARPFVSSKPTSPSPGRWPLPAPASTFDLILHLAAQAGVRYALVDPGAYTRSNLVGHHNVLEFARHHDGLAHLVYASSSSVYGNDTKPPFSEDARADKPVSYYGATKRAGELMSYSYAELFGLKQTGLRFFTVYGPWGRPDMAYWSFTDAILAGRPMPVFGGGKLKRDFTYVDDIVAALVRIVETPFAGTEGKAPHRIYNLGNHRPQTVMELIAAIEKATGNQGAHPADRRAEGRRQRDLCRHHARGARFRFRSHGQAGGRHRPLRRLVPAALRALERSGMVRRTG